MEKTTSSLPPILWGLAIVCLSLVVCNIITMQRYQQERRNCLALKQQEVERRQESKRASLQQITLWQAQIKCWALLEEGMEDFLRGDHAKAVKTLSESIEKCADSPPLAYYLRGIAYEAMKQDDMALADFDAYLYAVPSSTFGFLRRAQLHHRRRQLAEAKEDAERALQQNPNFESARLFLQQLESR